VRRLQNGRGAWEARRTKNAVVAPPNGNDFKYREAPLGVGASSKRGVLVYHDTPK